MVTLRTFAALSVAASSSLVSAMITCDANNPCPSSSPCCSSYGFCGVGAYCLGGCFPKDSFSLDSCMPAPTCKSANYDFNSLDGLIANTEYLGDPKTGSWVTSGSPLVFNDEAVMLTMTEDSSGTLISSTNYVWYGNISATMKTSMGQGVVTAFIMMSDVKDEIDFEFVGSDLQTAQSNFYFQGITDYGNSKNLSAANTESTWHTYTIDWHPDYLNWIVDGSIQRTLLRNETYNETMGQYHYPQTPSRVQFSLWPAGRAGNAQGTIDWAGGEINWSNSADMANGYYYAMVKDVTIDCYDPPQGYNNQGSNSYYYDNVAATNDTVVVGKNGTILSSFLATGENPKIGAKSSASTTGKNSQASSTSTPETVPGDSGGGLRGEQNPTDGSDSSSGSSSGSTGGSSSSGGGGSTVVQNGGFSQGLTTDTNDGNRVVAGSLVALVAFFAAAMLL